MMSTKVSDVLVWVGYRLFASADQSITTSSEPSRAECLQWINEVCSELLTLCVESGSEIGRQTASITTSADTSSYSDLANTLLTPYEMRDSDGKKFCGWIEKTNSRVSLILGTEADKLDYDPDETNEPDRFYIDGSNNIIFLNTPDDSYTVKIPYYPVHTVLTDVSDTVPFKGIFDNVIIESVTMRAQNREEYDLSFELKWYSYIRGQARKILAMRKGERVQILS